MKTSQKQTFKRSRIFKHIAVTDRLYDIITCPSNPHILFGVETPSKKKRKFSFNKINYLINLDVEFDLMSKE